MICFGMEEIMKCTSAEASKLLRKLIEEKATLEAKEERSRVFIAAVGEDIESVRPDYNYQETQDALEAVDKKIRLLKHIINCFNTTHMVPGFDMTIDQILVYIPQLSERKARLLNMKDRLPKQRVELDRYGSRTSSNLIEYTYANYDISIVEAEYERVADILAKAQTALDVINNTETMDIPEYCEK